MAYTYDDFVAAANSSGLMSNFSQYDLDLAKKNPEFGMSILTLKKDYGAATTDQQRALANAAANELRASYGNYRGGDDGSGFYVESKLNVEADDLLEGIQNYGKFEWDESTDPVWSAYKKQYRREGERATADTMGAAATQTGGIPSSYAVTAAQQAGDYYAGQMTDKLPTVYQQAYERYLGDYNMLQSKYNATAAAEQTEYGRKTAAEQTEYEREMAAAQTAEARRQQDIADAMNLWKIYGYATEEVAALLGVPVGTPTSDQAYTEWSKTQTGGGGGGSGGGSSAEEPADTPPVKYNKDATFTDGTPISTGYSETWQKARNMFDSGSTASQIASYIQGKLNTGAISSTEAARMIESLGLNKTQAQKTTTPPTNTRTPSTATNAGVTQKHADGTAISKGYANALKQAQTLRSQKKTQKAITVALEALVKANAIRTDEIQKILRELGYNTTTNAKGRALK